MPLKHVPINRRLLVGSELWLCIAQVARSKAALGPDSRNQSAAEAVAALLECDPGGVAPIDRDCDSSQLTRLMILPELALGWQDWETVDRAVKSYNKPLVLIAGIGFAQAGSIRDRVSFLDASVSDERNVNFGCAWVQLPAIGNLPALSEVHYYCKNFPEQSAEILAFDPVSGSEHTVLEFEDCSVAPLICADILADAQPGKQNAVDQLKAYRLDRGRPVIVAASVLQDKPWHAIWSSRIDRVVDGDLILALSNFAHDNRPSNYADDANRNLSGAYARAGLISNSSPQTIVCNGRDNPSSKGSVLRDSCQIFAAGILRVDSFSPTSGRHLWVSRWGQELVDGAFTPASTRLKFEMPRLLHRTRHLAPSSGENISRVVSHLGAAEDSRKVSFFVSLRDGPNAAANDPDPASSGTLNSATETALAVADALVCTSFFRWPADEKPTLEVCITPSSGSHPFISQGYVWRSSSETWVTMAARLQAYSQSPVPRPALVVFGEDMSGVDLQPDDISSHRDSASPQMSLDTFDTAAPRSDSNTVIVVPFSKAKRLSSKMANVVEFEDQAKAIQSSIIGYTGLSD